jgi:hyperosmotically inducible periplasmic protein
MTTRETIILSGALFIGAALMAAPTNLSAATTAEKAGEKAEKAADRAEKAADRAEDAAKGDQKDANKTGTAKEPINDSWLTAKTKLALVGDGRVKGRQINVETKKGVVMLRGKVDTDEAKAAAEETAKAIDGVKKVKNELQVVAPAQREAVEEKDEVLTDRVEREINKDAKLKKADIDVKTNAGVVSLTGEVPDISSSAKASWTAWKVVGVKSVKNDLTIKDKK